MIGEAGVLGVCGGLECIEKYSENSYLLERDVSAVSSRSCESITPPPHISLIFDAVINQSNKILSDWVGSLGLKVSKFHAKTKVSSPLLPLNLSGNF
jgi:hypothetical protein